MTDPREIQSPARIYADSRAALDAAELTYQDLVKKIVKQVAGEHYVTSRVKSARSLIRKLSKDPSAVREWASITDKVGVRVICSTKRDCKAARQALESYEWAQCETEKKTGAVDRLFYAGVHLTVHDGVATDSVSGPILCEIQLRTRSQDAWSVVSHKLLYKGMVDPPYRVQRVIHRLAAVVEIFDDEVQRMFKKRERMPAYELARAVEYLDDRFEAVLGEPGGAPTDLSIISVLWNAYTAEERLRFAELIDDYIQRTPELRTCVQSHQPDNDAYIDGRDWLWTQPEVLAVLERAGSREALLAHAISGTDLEEVVRKTCDSIGVILDD